MAKRLFNATRYHVDGTKFRLEIVDLYGSGSNLDYDFEIADPGYNITYPGSVDEITLPIQGSGMAFSGYFSEANRDVLMGILYGQKEFSLACGLYLYDEFNNEKLEWCGLILPEETSEEISDQPILITFQCTDGLSTLKTTDFKEPDGDIYEGERPLIFFVFECLKKLPHWPYYFSGTTYEFLYEVGTPVSSRTTGSLTNELESSLTTLFVHSRTFYESEKKPSGFRLLIEPNEAFSSSYSVLEDVMLALGCTLTLANGAWWVFNKPYLATLQNHGSVKTFGFYNINVSPYYESYDFDQNYLVDLDASKVEFSSGVIRSGVYPFRGATQTHLASGSDVIFRNGREYLRSSSGDVRAVLYTFNDHDYPNYEIRNLPIFHIRKPSTGEFDNDDLNLWDVGSKGKMPIQITSLNIPSGPDGRITFTASGTISFKRTAIVQHGLCPILSFEIQALTDTGQIYRLRRRVRTNNNFEVSIFNDLDRYYPKYYEYQGGYTWVLGGDVQNRFDCLIAMDPDYVVSGDTERFLQTDYPNELYFTPVRTKIREAGENSDNVLRKVNDSGKSEFDWAISHTFEMPVLASGNFVELRIYRHVLEVYHPESGPLPTGGGSYTPGTVPDFRTATSTDGSAVIQTSNLSLPTSYTLNGVHVYVGDGSEGYDVKVMAFNSTPSMGEIKDLGATRIGAASNTATIANGRLRAEFGTPGTRYDGLNWNARGDESLETSLHYLNCQEFMSVRHRVRQAVSGQFVRHSGSSIPDSLVRPYNVLKTNKLAGGGTEYLLPVSLNNNSSSFSLESLVCRFVRDAITEADETRGPTRNPNGSNPNGADVEIGPEGRLKQRLAVTEGKTDLIQVSVPITDENLGGGGDSDSSVIFSMFIGKAFNG
jgi:hypothetical protein